MRLDEIRKLAQAATPGPYFVAYDKAEECGPHANSGLSLVDTGRQEDWPIARLCETQSANLIAALSPERVLLMLAVIEAAKRIKERCAYYDDDDWLLRLGAFDAALAALEDA